MLNEFAIRKPRLTSALLWLAAIAFTLATFAWQERTGPTAPVEGELTTPSGPVRFFFVRSETINTALPIVLLDPVPAGVSGRVEYRRYSSHDAWSVVPMRHGAFDFARHGRTTALSGLGAELPGLPERAGKYEIFVRVAGEDGRLVSITGNEPFYARFKAHVPTWALIAHILAIFTSMMFAIRTVLEAAIDGNYRWMVWATLVALLLGAFALGPLAQWYAFGVWWAGVPFGYDWTDNKVLLSLAAWGFAAWANRGARKNRRAVFAAGVVTLLVYFIPHSIFGSEFDYRTGKGHGTAG